MGRPIKDLTGKRFGRLTVLGIAYKTKHSDVYWRCKCDCGTIKNVLVSNLNSGNVKSCGCYMKDRIKETNSTHGCTKKRIYKIYRGILNRCKTTRQKDYKNYKGKGIEVCEEWANKESGFLNFYEWSMSNGYSDDLTIDRINSNGNYEPSNCRWATMLVQLNNTNRNHYITYKGETKTMAQWARHFGMNYGTLSMRLNRYKMSFEQALERHRKQQNG